VWLDIAGRPDGQQLIVPLRVLKHQRRLELFVPTLIMDEFERNRPRAEAALTNRVHSRFCEVAADIRRLADVDEQYSRTMRSPRPAAASPRNSADAEAARATASGSCATD
jgi:hypothetical protein